MPVMVRFLGALLLSLAPLLACAQDAVPPADARAVRLTDADGRAWIALYPMQRQPDGSWRTNGCQLARLAGTRT